MHVVIINNFKSQVHERIHTGEKVAIIFSFILFLFWYIISYKIEIKIPFIFSLTNADSARTVLPMDQT